MSRLTVGSLFAGIGGFDLGFERAGFEIRWQVEIDPFCREVLAKHWPDVRRYEDVRTTHVADARCEHGRAWWDAQEGLAVQRFQAGDLAQRHSEIRTYCPGCLPVVDVLCGGFPCQPHSLAGRRAGADDERDLWPEFARLIRELRPRWVVAENVPGLLSSNAGRFFGTVLGDLASCGYDAEWDCLPASAFGAPHRRDRVWLVSYPNGWRQRECPQFDGATIHDSTDRDSRGQHLDGLRDAVADAGSNGLERPIQANDGECAGARVFAGCSLTGGAGEAGTEQWRIEPDVGRVAHGVPARVDRLRGLGNAIVPQIAEWIAHKILDAESGRQG